jgi:hypothetical protein
MAEAVPLWNGKMAALENGRSGGPGKKRVMRFGSRLFIPLAISLSSLGFGQLTSPKAFLGHDVCEDYMLANYKQLKAYFEKLDKESDRMVLTSIGKTEEGRDQVMAIISDPANLRDLRAHRTGSEELARGRIAEAEARELIKKHKTVVWIDGGLHANETLGAQQLIETVWQVVSRNDEENRRILRDCVILVVHANPDGMDLVSDWYMRKTEPKERSLAGVPVLYQKYIGHDNNRDFYASNMAETRNMNRVLYSEWYPQIVYNHHQTAPSGTIMFVPPFRNPFNYHVDPLAQISTDMVGVAMHTRMIGKGMGGTVMRNAANYQTWWNGGLRTTTYFHNMVGILTETFGNPTPSRVPFSKERQIPSTDAPMPVPAGEWRMKQSLAYEVEANYAILDYASRYREQMLWNTYRMARNSIERGQKDTWTRYPSRINAVGEKALSDPALRDARFYVLSADQPDKGSLRWFIDRLLATGIEVLELSNPWSLNGKTYPAGSYVVPMSQAFRPHILDMFEMQDYPNDFRYEGGPPIPPYDSAGYTPAFTMGVEFDRILDAPGEMFKAEPVIRIELWNTPARSAAVPDFRDLDTYRALNASGNSKVRIGLWDRYGGSMESGWTRWILEKFAFNFQLIFPPDINAGGLRDKFDAIILPSGALGAGQGGGGGAQNPLLEDPTVPAEYKRRIGAIDEQGIAALKKFVEDGGHLLAIGSSATNAARQLGLPVTNGMVETDEQGRTRPLPSTKFFIPGSVLRIQLTNDHELARGLKPEIDVMMDDSPAFVLTQGSEGIAHSVARFESDKPLRSGWAWGQELLKDKHAVVDCTLGKGRVVLYGPEVLFRAQPTQSFKLVFNALMRAGRP